MKPICIPCQRFYRPVKSGFSFVEGMPIGDNVLPGKSDLERWVPYKLWQGDKWACPDCGSEIIVGTRRDPVSEHYMLDFSEKVTKFGGDQFQVNDC